MTIEWIEVLNTFSIIIGAKINAIVCLIKRRDAKGPNDIEVK